MIGRSLLPGLNMLPGANAMPGAQAPSPNGGFDLLELLSSPGMQLSMSALGASEPGGGGWQAMAYAAPQIAAQHKQKQRDEALAAAMSEMFGDNPQQAELARMFPEQAAQHAFGQAFPEPSDPYTLGPGDNRYDANNKLVASAPFRPNDTGAAGGFTLSEGQTRFDADGNPIASVDVDPTAALDPSKEGALRREVLGQLKPFGEVQRAYGKIEQSLEANTAAGDMAGVFSFMKMLDPGSTVREGEYANAENARGIPSTVRNIYNRVLSGQRLTPDQRQDFMSRSNEMFVVEQAKANDILRQYGTIAEQYGFDPSRITGFNTDPLSFGGGAGGVPSGFVIDP